MILIFFSPWFSKKSSNQGHDNIISSCFNAALDVKPKLKANPRKPNIWWDKG
jgi:hypothetical protein